MAWPSVMRISAFIFCPAPPNTDSTLPAVRMAMATASRAQGNRSRACCRGRRLSSGKTVAPRITQVVTDRTSSESRG
jgi:hypothetical protein